MKGVRRKDNILKAIELKQNNPNITQGEIAKILDITIPAVSQIFKRHKVDWNRIQTWKTVQAEVILGLQEKMLTGITEDKIKDASLKDITVSAGILQDKYDQITGKTKDNNLLSDIIERVAKNAKEVTINVNQNIDTKTVVVEQ